MWENRDLTDKDHMYFLDQYIIFMLNYFCKPLSMAARGGILQIQKTHVVPILKVIVYFNCLTQPDNRFLHTEGL
jgi:hypothetical protein